MTENEGLEISGAVSVLVGDVAFFAQAPDGAHSEVLRLRSNGDILVRGRFAENDRAVVEALRAVIMNNSPPTPPHCESCTCGKRAPVQGSRTDFHGVMRPPGSKGIGPGTVAWSEHALAWGGYAARYGQDQSAERISERGGFGYSELVHFLGREPETWRPR